MNESEDVFYWFRKLNKLIKYKAEFQDKTTNDHLVLLMIAACNVILMELRFNGKEVLYRNNIFDLYYRDKYKTIDKVMENRDEKIFINTKHHHQIMINENYIQHFNLFPRMKLSETFDIQLEERDPLDPTKLLKATGWITTKRMLLSPKSKFVSQKESVERKFLSEELIHIEPKTRTMHKDITDDEDNYTDDDDEEDTDNDDNFILKNDNDDDEEQEDDGNDNFILKEYESIEPELIDLKSIKQNIDMFIK